MHQIYNFSIANKAELAAIGGKTPAFLQPAPPTVAEAERERLLEALQRDLATRRLVPRVARATGFQAPPEPDPEPL